MSGLREQLESVRETFGSLTPANVVEAARPADAPLHDRFEWDDSVAAEAWRRDQARELIRSYRVTVKESETGPVTVRGYVSVRGEESPSPVYEPVEDVLADDFQRAMLLRELEREIARLRVKFGHLSEFAALLRNAAA